MGSTEAPNIELPRALTLGEAVPLSETLKARIDDAVTLDASNVEHLGAQCLQILLSANKTWSDAGKSFTVVNPSIAFVEGLDRLGISKDTFAQ